MDREGPAAWLVADMMTEEENREEQVVDQCLLIMKASSKEHSPERTAFSFYFLSVLQYIYPSLCNVASFDHLLVQGSQGNLL
jgi:hypothetical protein